MMIDPIKIMIDRLHVFKWWSLRTIEERYHILILAIILFLAMIRHIEKSDHKEQVIEIKNEYKEEIKGIRARGMIREATLQGELKECQNSRFEDGIYFRDKYEEIKNRIENR